MYVINNLQVWDFEAIDNADITDEKNRVFEMEPMYESKVSTYHIFLLMEAQKILGKTLDRLAGQGYVNKAWED